MTQHEQQDNQEHEHNHNHTPTTDSQAESTAATLGHFGLIEPLRQRARQEVIERLIHLGYLTLAESRIGTKVRAAIIGFQRWHGLIGDGAVGPTTERAMFQPRFGRCGLPDVRQREAGRICQWPIKNIPLWPRLTLLELSREEIESIFTQACQAWNDVCGIQLTVTTTAREALIIADAGRGRKDSFDGQGGTLAWSYMPCGMNRNDLRPLQQKYDTAELWTADFLRIVATHEIGHAIGLDHLPAGNLMAPSYNPRVGVPQSGDIAAAVRRYGPPVRSTPVDPGAAIPPVNPPATPDAPGEPVDPDESRPWPDLDALIGTRLVLRVEDVQA